MILKHNSPLFLVFSVIFTIVSSFPLRNVTDSIIENSTETFNFPDWVPFKNKHGDELGEFKPVPKAKPKKRLALPANFVLRSVAEADSEDYYEKDMGESEDNYEIKDWSDTSRQVNPDNLDINVTAIANHTDISDIEGIVNVILDSDSSKNIQIQNNSGENTSKEKDEGDNGESDETKEKTKDKKLSGEEEDDYEVEDATSEKSKAEAEEERKENEAKKASILNSVDALKARHAAESRAISEKTKEEEVYREELERDKLSSQENLDKYGNVIPHKVEYDDYDNKETTIGEKYKINPLNPKKTTTTKQPPLTSKWRYAKNITNKKPVHDDGKLSVFKHPRAYMLFDYDDGDKEPSPRPNATPKSTATRKPHSNRYTKPSPKANSDENVRINFVPEDSEGKEEEPTLFFPIKQRKKGRNRGKNPRKHYRGKIPQKNYEKDLDKHLYSSTRDIIDSDRLLTAPSGSGPSGPDTQVTSSGRGTTDSVSLETGNAEDLTSPSASDTSASEVTAKDTTGHGRIGDESKEAVDDSALSAASAPSAVADADLAGSEHHKEAPKDYKYEKGGEKEHESHHESSSGEHGKKAYEGIHKDSKTEKKHHDKESHSGVYDDHGGHDKQHHDEKNHHASHHHEEHGKKHAKYEESGKHSKGHSTKGSHDIHKKEEYEKKVEFFEEDGDSAEEEKFGGHKEDKKHSSGGKYKKGNLQSEYLGHFKGDSGKSSGGGQGNGYKAHKHASGHDSHGKEVSDHGNSGSKQADKKWIYHHGHPAKTANLVLIDRRTDQYHHGPQYFG